MARPKKETEIRHNRRITLRLTETEYDIISHRAENVHLPIAEYVRKHLMGKRLSIKYEVVADIPELKKLIAEFGRIGNNLNQIARHFNQGGIHSQEMRNSINQSITELYELKFKVLKMAGNFYGNTETFDK